MKTDWFFFFVWAQTYSSEFGACRFGVSIDGNFPWRTSCLLSLQLRADESKEWHLASKTCCSPNSSNFKYHEQFFLENNGLLQCSPDVKHLSKQQWLCQCHVVLYTVLCEILRHLSWYKVTIFYIFPLLNTMNKILHDSTAPLLSTLLLSNQTQQYD